MQQFSVTTINNVDESISKQPQPLYQRIKFQILKKIRNGDWQENARVPSEKELSEVMGVSRMTANRALRELTDEGYVIRIQGVGTFVAPQKNQSAILEVKNIADEIMERNGVHSCEILLLQEEQVTAELAANLEIPLGSRVFHSVILHKDRNVPVQLAERYVNPTIAPEYLTQDFHTITPSEYLFSIAPLTEVEHFIEAINPDEKTRNLLQTKPDEACLLLHRRTWSHGRVVTKCEFRYPGSKSRLGGKFPACHTGKLII